jgi:hypothetical protein
MLWNQSLEDCFVTLLLAMTAHQGFPVYCIFSLSLQMFDDACTTPVRRAPF